MTRLSAEDVAARTLARQFPTVPGRDEAAVLELLRRLGPIQSQVPRSPFLTASSRLPGVGYPVVQGLFARYGLLKTSSIRGTVHTSVAEQYGWLDSVARRGRRGALAGQLGLRRTTPEELLEALENFADAEWQPRTDVVGYARRWLAEHESDESASAVTGSYVSNLLWGHSGLVRRPPDERWETRTDVLHRRARSVVAGLGEPAFADSLAALVRVQLGALGPLTRADLGYFFGTGLGAVDTALTTLDDELVHLTGPEGEDHVDLAEPGADDPGELGVRLLPEFDALLVGLHARHRTRFLDSDQLDEVWAKANGQFAPAVLQHGRIVGTWRTVAQGSRVRLEVRTLARCTPPAEDELAAPAAALAQGMGVRIADLRVLR
jgi:hypothetical protein